MSLSLADHLRQLPHDTRDYNPGQLLFSQGDPVISLHLVEQGEIHLVRHQIGGFALTLQRAGSAAILAEASLFSPRYHCDAIARHQSRTAVIAKSTIRRELQRNPELAETWAGYLAQEVQTARLRAEILALRTVAERLDAWMALNNGQLPRRGEQKTVATEIGVSPEALYREFAARRGNHSLRCSPSRRKPARA